VIAPHPDDEALACSVILQQALRAETAVRVIYATDGDNNPWPQRFVERKWRLATGDRRRWGKLRRAEALAALRVLGAPASNVRFLALPDQGLTDLLTQNCGSMLELFETMISSWAPTHLLVPSIVDRHPDHNALGVMLRLVSCDFPLPVGQMSIWSYAVHGKSGAFTNRAINLQQSKDEALTKVRAIRCHKTQLKLSQRRFLGYATRPEQFLKLRPREETVADGSIHSVTRQPDMLRLKLQLTMQPLPTAKPRLFVLGYDRSRALTCVSMRLPSRPARTRILSCVAGRQLGTMRYRGDAFAGEASIPIDRFSQVHPLFVKLERRGWFFDEGGWLEVPAVAPPQRITVRRQDLRGVFAGDFLGPARRQFHARARAWEGRSDQGPRRQC